MQQISHTAMHTAPLFPVAAGMIVGIVLDGRLQPGVLAYGAPFVLISALVLIRRIRALIGPLLVFTASLCVGGVLHLATARTIPASSIERYTGETKRIARVRGVVVSEPRILDIPPNPFARWSYGSQRTAFLLETQSIEGLSDEIPVTGRVRVTVGEAVLDLRENEHVEVFGWLYRFQPPRNPGSFDWSSFYRRQGVVAGLRCNHRENVQRLDAEPPVQGRDFVTWLRTTVRGMLTDDLATGTDEEASLLEAMILGHRSRLDRRLNDVFIRAGVVHFLAVSGTHVVVVMSFVWFVGRIFRRTKRRCAWLMMLTVCAYALIAEPRPPILRATVIAVLFCASLLLRRPRARLNWISAAAVVLLLCDPVGVFDVGFQLSFAAVLGVTYITPALLQAGPELRNLVDRVIFRRPFAEQDRQIVDDAIRQTSPLAWRARHAVQRFLLVFLAVSVGAWLAGMPVVVGHFNRVHPWGPISSVIVFPLMYVVMIVGLIKIVVSVGFPALSIIIANLLAVADRFLIWIVENLSSLPGASIPTATPSWWLIAAFYVVLVLFAWAFSPGPRHLSEESIRSTRMIPVPRRWLKAASLLAFALLIVTTVVWPYTRQLSDRLVVTVLSVGAGSAVVIELPDGHTILNDAGSRGPYDVGRNTVVPFLRHRGIRRIDRVHVSHPNLDHFSGLPSILEEVDAGPIIINPCFEPRSPPRSPARHLLDLLADRGHPVEILGPADRRWELGGVTFELLSPFGDLDESISVNETSTVMRLSYGGHSMLLTGDIEERTLRALLERGALRADVLVLPHHGSVEPTSKAFVDAVGARALIRSSHQRMDETFNGLQAVVGTTPLFNTADLGAVRVVIDETGVRVAGHRSSPIGHR
ncbi:MAG: ComEC/Rec2 family competence protein [Phycisphaerales bacterium]|nr:MAG: ComEC/Rec2 family competence protein [Phycisphaerales bacterium]